jgi:outer membrane immunogenic protein
MTRTKFLLATALVAPIALSATAQAADLPAPVIEPIAPIVAPVVAPFTFAGFYVGATAGYAWADVEGNRRREEDRFRNEFNVDFDHDDDESDLEGFIGGPLVGFNAQFGSFVVGAEGDFLFTDIDSDERHDREVFDRETGERLGRFTVEDTLEIDYLASVRARAGFAFNRFMVYGTGGVAFTDIESHARGEAFDRDGQAVDGFFDNEEDDDDTQVGYTLGAGVETAFTDNVTARIEYLYYNFEEDDDSGDREGAFRLSGVDEVEIHTVRAGVTFKFNGLFQ